MAEIVALLAARREEIKAIRKLWKDLCTSLGIDAAKNVITEAVTSEAYNSGKRLSPAKSDKEAVAGLEHFSHVFKTRYGDGGVEMEAVLIEEGKLTLHVARCDYPSLYRNSPLPEDLVMALTCGSEEAFAKGYDSRLVLEECLPPDGDGRCCTLIYRWEGGR